MAEAIKRAVRSFAGGIRYITLSPARRGFRPRRCDPSRYWFKTGERMARATKEVGRAIAAK